MKKHYCFLTGLYSRTDSLMVVRQGKTLVEHGYDVSMILCDDRPNEIVNGINFISTHFQPKGRIDRFWNTYKKILPLALAADADIYQISDPELLSMVIPLKKKGKKVIFNMREFYPDMILHKAYIPYFLRSTISLLYEKMLQHYLPMYDSIMVVTERIKDVIEDKWHIPQIAVISNYPWIHRGFQLSFEDYCKRGDVLCYEGTIYVESRQENVFKALEDFPNMKYVLAGKFDEGYEHIKTLPYWSHVNFINGFKIEDLPSILATASIANAFRDFFGKDGSMGVIKIFDAMEAGLPVLLADVPLYRELTNKYKCGLCVNPNDVQSIKSAISYLITHKQEAYEMGQNGRKAVLDKYCWDVQSVDYLRIIESI